MDFGWRLRALQRVEHWKWSGPRVVALAEVNLIFGFYLSHSLRIPCPGKRSARFLHPQVRGKYQWKLHSHSDYTQLGDWVLGGRELDIGQREGTHHAFPRPGPVPHQCDSQPWTLPACSLHWFTCPCVFTLSLQGPLDSMRAVTPVCRLCIPQCGTQWKSGDLLINCITVYWILKWVHFCQHK